MTWTNQGIALIQLLLGHLCKNEEIGELTNTLLETLQLVIGSSLPLFHYPLSQVLKYCTRNWLLNVWEFLLSIHGTIHLERASYVCNISGPELRDNERVGGMIQSPVEVFPTEYLSALQFLHSCEGVQVRAGFAQCPDQSMYW